MPSVDQLVAHFEAFGIAVVPDTAAGRVDDFCAGLGARPGPAALMPPLRDDGLPGTVDGTPVAAYFVWPAQAAGPDASVTFVPGSHRGDGLTDHTRQFYVDVGRGVVRPSAPVYARITVRPPDMVAVAPGLLLGRERTALTGAVRMRLATLATPAGAGGAG